jgi:hypothetical protein
MAPVPQSAGVNGWVPCVDGTRRRSVATFPVSAHLDSQGAGPAAGARRSVASVASVHASAALPTARAPPILGPGNSTVSASRTWVGAASTMGIAGCAGQRPCRPKSVAAPVSAAGASADPGTNRALGLMPGAARVPALAARGARTRIGPARHPARCTNRVARIAYALGAPTAGKSSVYPIATAPP